MLNVPSENQTEIKLESYSLLQNLIFRERSSAYIFLLLTKITAVQNEAALSHQRVRDLYCNDYIYQLRYFRHNYERTIFG